jgi:hypothetical protein
MMSSDGRVHAVEESPDGRFRRTYSSAYPIPEGCNERKILKAFEKLFNGPQPVPPTAATLLPLTPMEKGFVLGVLAEYHARKG